MLDEKSGRKLLLEQGACPEVMAHSEAVLKSCLKTVSKIKKTNPSLKINLTLVKAGALLHDIGRAKSHGIDHGIVGAEIMRSMKNGGPDDVNFEKIARICERHLGAGISEQEAEKMGLPPGRYVPKTIEEKIIAYSDNLVDDDTLMDASWAQVDFEKKHGKRSEPAKRVRELNKFFSGLMA